jgi:tripartite-type tricarboxylate transporter receptor subunit TctC
MQDLVAGQIDMFCAEASQTLTFLRGGKMKAYAVMSKARWPLTPDVPTMDELGLKGFDATTWHGLVAPAGTPPDIINKINRDVIKVLSEPAFAEQYLTAQGLEPIFGTPEKFAAFIRAETVKWGKVVKDANILVTK